MSGSPGAAPRRVLGNRAFLLLWIGQTISSLGDWIAFVGLMVLIYTLTRSVGAIALLRIGHAVPILLIAPVAGVFVDRWNQKTTLVVTNVASAVLVLLYAVFPQVLPLVLIHVALTVALIFFNPARAAVVPRLVAPEDLSAANALISLTNTLAVILGSALGGALVAWLGTAVTFYLDAASFGVAAVSVSLIRLPRDQASGTGRVPGLRAVWADLRDGLAYAWRDRVVRMVVGLALVFAGAPAMVITLGVVFAETVRHAGASGYGALVAATGVGALAGALAMLWAGERLPPARGLGWGGLLMGGGIAGLGVSRTLPLGILLYGGGGVGTAMADVAAATLLGRLVPPALRGRIFSLLYMLQHVSVLLGSAAAGLLTIALGPGPLIVAAGLLAALGGAAGLLALARVAPGERT
ncbi:MAG: MFS transporter [Chloroflexota bacterium]